MIKKILIIGLFAGLINAASAQQKAMLRLDSIRRAMDKVVIWQIGEFAQGHVKSSEIGWENGALYTGIIALKKLNNVPAYDRFLYNIGEKHNWDTGPYRLFADDYCVAQMYTAMYLEHHQPKMIAKWTKLADTIVRRRFNDSLAISAEITHKEWAWCDALYMGPVGLALLTKATGNPQYLNKADSLWWKTSAYLYDKQEHLYYRDNRFFTQREKNGQKIFWSRGNGWVIAGLAHMLELMPRDFKNRKLYQQQFKEIAARIAALQQPDGSWHASLLDPVTFNEKETSGTAFYCYAFAWGINHGLLSKKQYLPLVNKAWAALITSVHPDGKLGYVQNVGSGPIAANYNSTNTYGVGAFLLAGTEVYQLYKK
ncbi:glycoside hydrolase family 88 protein [Mucilaginibacter mali]|uniref:Glycoside hydrolase family 88 protein n=1 Tax=Mucilaginibacter mali TaxID=2740462 RepID=A0A7D4PZU1_9SPHI|nr:glycoside hydrolase family 88 protein [Mucilaginibacter mali]QKJ29206.1 glycoside hydrolase family 88 protein [Mucilaginibacter mali]